MRNPAFSRSFLDRPAGRAARSFLAVAVLLAGTSVVARGQVAATGDVIQTSVAGFASGDRDKVMAARVSLISALTGHPPEDKTFFANYARDLSVALAPIVNGNDPHAKLNAALVIGRVADRSGTTTLADLIAKLIRDPSPAIASYGMRAAQNLLPRMLADQKMADANPIVPAIIEAVQKNPGNESVIDEAYNAMAAALNDTRGAASLLGPQVVADATPRTVDALHQLLALRLRQMGRNELADPLAEQPAISFLGRKDTWAASTAPQRLKTIGVIVDLVAGVVAELESVPPEKQAGAQRERALALRGIFKSAAQTLSVISDLSSKPELKTTAQLAGQLGNATPVADYRRVANTIQADFRKAYPDLPPSAVPQTQPAAR